MKKKLKIKKALLCIGLCALTIGASAVTAFPHGYMATAEEVESSFETSDVETDLSDLGDLKTLYPVKEDGKPSLVRFQEYCYSELSLWKDAYGLYFYIYNPTGKPVHGKRCTVNMAVDYLMGSPIEYANVELRLLDNTDDWTLLKFKVADDENLYDVAKENANSQNNIRRYDIAGFQLYYKDGGVLDDYNVSKSYLWKGFAEGMNNNAESTLTCEVQGLETLSLDVKHTYYRIENSADSIKSDAVHSVYFSVPNEYLDTYGSLYRIHAEYLGARLKPALVLGDRDVYNEVAKYTWQDTSSHIESLNYEIAAHFYWDSGPQNFRADYIFNHDPDVRVWPDGEKWIENSFEHYGEINNLSENGKGNILYLLFGTDGFSENSADSYHVSSETIKEQMLLSAKNPNSSGNVVGVDGEYSRDIFSWIDTTKRSIILTADDTFDLTQTVYEKNFWDKIFKTAGREGSEVVKTIFSKQPVIHKVTEQDFIYGDVVDSQKLMVASQDFSDFKNAYIEATENNETLFLFHYNVSTYEAREATIFAEHDPAIGAECFRNISTNGYFFEQDVDLAFDIIDVMFLSEDGTETVISVVSKPVDFVPGSTPPNMTTNDKKSFWDKLSDWWRDFITKDEGELMSGLMLTLIIIGAYLILCVIGKVIYPVIPFLFAGVGALYYIVTLPLRLIALGLRALINKIRGD